LAQIRRKAKGVSMKLSVFSIKPTLAWGLRVLVALAVSGCGLEGLNHSDSPFSQVEFPSKEPQGNVVRHSGDERSWITPLAKSGGLLYVSDGVSNVYVFSYPAGSLVGKLTGLSDPSGECADKAGNIFITTFDSASIVEYAHGGTSPIATLNDPGYPLDCAVDPTTGNLAVTNHLSSSEQPGSIAIYKGGRGEPTLCSDSIPIYYNFCGYDDQGNLYFNGESATSGSYVFAELPQNSSTFTNISLNQTVEYPGSVQWDGSYITEANSDASEIYRIQISGSTGTIVGQTQLKEIESAQQVQIAIQSDRVVVPYGSRPGHGVAKIGFWPYPKGGNHVKNIRYFGADSLFGLAISVKAHD
jgi:hypothetical protein